MPADSSALPEGVATGGLPVDAAHLVALRRARRRRRVAEIHWVDALYRAYVAALFGVLGVVLVAGAVGDEPLTAAQVDRVVARGPAVVGLVAAAAVAVGLRSGSRGGPLALEAADVRHVLLAPIDRGRVLRGPALRQLRFGLFAAAVGGAAAGRFTVARLPGSTAAWIATGAAALATVVALGLGAALVAGGRRLSRPGASALAAALVLWAALDVARASVGGTTIPPSPGRAVGWLALLPLDASPAAVAAPLVAVLALAVGIAGIAGLSVEAAERRTALVGQIRFAATLQDVRTVLVLRRQLASDRPRDRPWWPSPAAPARWPAWRRGWRGLARFPVTRLVRLVLLAALAGLALRGAWSGTTPLVVGAGLALWIAGLDVVEPLAQEVDHPGRRRSYPVPEGDLYVRLLGPSAVLAAVLGLLAGGVAALPGPGAVPIGAALVAGVLTAITGAAGAVVNTTSGMADANDSLSLMAPEVAGTRTLLRAVWPPLVAVTGALPLLVVRAAHEAGRPPAAGAVPAWLAVLTLVALVGAWVHQREAVLAWWADALKASGAGRPGPSAPDAAGDGDGGEDPGPVVDGGAAGAGDAGSAGDGEGDDAGGAGSGPGAEAGPAGERGSAGRKRRR